MRVKDVLKTSWRGITHAKVRSLLTMLGIVIGIASVILLMSLGGSAERLIISQIQGAGSNLVFVVPGATKGSRFASPPSAQGIIIKTLVEADARALRADPVITAVSPQVNGQAKVVFENNDTTVSYLGVSGEFFAIRNLVPATGMVFTDADVDAFNRVAVLGSEIATTLFGQRDPIGKQIRLKDVSFRVAGVLGKEGVGPFGIDQDNAIVIPISIAQKQLLGIDHYTVLMAQASDQYDTGFITSRMTSILRQNHRITDPNKDDFTIRTQEDVIALLGSITSVMTAFLTSIACISLVVGGIGIMNIMLVSVVERTREIGLRKAIGATNRDILQQFLFEAVIITMIGGVIGVVMGVSLAGLAAVILSQVIPDGWTFVMPPSAIILAFGVSFVTGIVFGGYPARKASLKSPMEALRYE